MPDESAMYDDFARMYREAAASARANLDEALARGYERAARRFAEIAATLRRPGP